MEENSDDGGRGWLPLRWGGVGSSHGGPGQLDPFSQDGLHHHHLCLVRPPQEVAQAAQEDPAVADPETILLLLLLPENLIFCYTAVFEKCISHVDLLVREHFQTSTPKDQEQISSTTCWLWYYAQICRREITQMGIITFLESSRTSGHGSCQFEEFIACSPLLWYSE